MKRLVIGLLLLAGAAVSISLTPAARGRTDEAALKLSGADAALFNPAHDCTYCHGLHGASAAQLLNNANVEALCVGCHDGSFDPDGPGPRPPAPVADVHKNDPTGNSCCDPFRITCNECHDPHSNPINRLGNENLKLVLDTVVTPFTLTRRAVVFESRGGGVDEPTLYSFCDDDQDANGVWDQICDVCHEGTQMGRHHWDGSLNHHKDGDTCTRSGCHVHSNALSP